MKKKPLTATEIIKITKEVNDATDKELDDLRQKFRDHFKDMCLEILIALEKE